jgi:hypothetical protein
MDTVRTRSELIAIGGLKLAENEFCKTLIMDKTCPKCKLVLHYFTPIKLRWDKCPSCGQGFLIQ